MTNYQALECVLQQREYIEKLEDAIRKCLDDSRGDSILLWRRVELLRDFARAQEIIPPKKVAA